MGGGHSSEDLGQFDCNTVDGQVICVHADYDPQSATKGYFCSEQGNRMANS